ncbi:sugar phosphate isomerase/epimerase [Halogeometricum sp. S1BR25-6]|uniref:Sugar phosphate isomerase/epimerase n=1 Tax=Halogeometricum salsisoli TaxID=2950536 RepID=A0ABU2GEY5_9EURY|nr:sugar phosphate isomerase/epimerase family protein [Halogeometricum sp. S1BR25-6]MDS0298879.1 sugar phosphate isomerase/epimerase [Halogeometricum sp. S1BR25-6]
MSLQFGFSMNAFREYSTVGAIEAVADAGYDGIELLFDEPFLYPPTATGEEYDEVESALDTNDIAISNCNAFMLTAIEDFHHPSFIEPDEDYRRRRVDYTLDTIDAAAELGCDRISIEPGGPVPEEKSREWAMDTFVEGLDELAERAERKGVDVMVEPEPDLLIETSDEYLDLMDRVDSERITCNFDAGHLFCMGEDPAELVETLAPYTRHYHLEDIPEDRSHEHTQLGDGAMDIDGFLQAVEDSGYDGYVTVELYPYQETAAETAQGAMDYLRERGWA